MEKPLTSRAHLKSHILLQHTAPPAISHVTIKCSIDNCHEEYRTYAQLNRHQLEVHVVDGAELQLMQSSSKLVCMATECMKSFSTFPGLQYHRNQKHSENTVACHFCANFKCSDTELLGRHINRFHNPLNPFICTVTGCGRRYASKPYWAEHKRRAQH
ncbi:hypothetical protein BCR43DRAFT_105296 [Syncephalastrum racemosum]|uniref:C2H2-type domain-containing protein n=1 Tax=Syncephalastrum racemosum TaxID=13706 RepID=A0A1X2H1P3_SYNRA|nr:hypothetical protein BCR43DRAFT_105296 [Syncephalastrum racemosum]